MHALGREDREIRREWNALYSRVFAGACAVSVVLAGVAVGLFTKLHEHQRLTTAAALVAIERTLAESADLRPRLAELETRHEDHEQRIRELERARWRHDGH